MTDELLAKPAAAGAVAARRQAALVLVAGAARGPAHRHRRRPALAHASLGRAFRAGRTGRSLRRWAAARARRAAGHVPRRDAAGHDARVCGGPASRDGAPADARARPHHRAAAGDRLHHGIERGGVRGDREGNAAAHEGRSSSAPAGRSTRCSRPPSARSSTGSGRPMVHHRAAGRTGWAATARAGELKTLQRGARVQMRLCPASHFRILSPVPPKRRSSSCGSRPSRCWDRSCSAPGSAAQGPGTPRALGRLRARGRARWERGQYLGRPRLRSRRRHAEPAGAARRRVVGLVRIAPGYRPLPQQPLRRGALLSRHARGAFPQGRRRAVLRQHVDLRASPPSAASIYYNSISEAKTGFGATAGVGFDIRLGRNMYLVPELDWYLQAVGDTDAFVWRPVHHQHLRLHRRAGVALTAWARDGYSSVPRRITTATVK